jgi:excisionase family DNA binding protein
MTQLSLSIEDAAKSIGCGRVKVYQAINSGALKARKFGKRTIILQSDLEDFLASLQPYPAKNAGA